MAVATGTMSPATSIGETVATGIPPLESGDRLTRSEFERRYHAMPAHVRAELIEGIVYVASPVSRKHGRFHFDLNGWLAVYSGFTPGVEGATDATVRLDLDNEPQPDLLLRIRSDHGGRSGTSEDGYIEGAPELVVEVAASSASYDLHDKLKIYRRNRVLEYAVWRVWDRAIDWFALRDGEYVRLQATADGLLRSEVFPGLWLDVQAMLRGDAAHIFRAVQDGIHSPEHAAFVASLQKAAARLAAPPVAPDPEAPRP